MHSFLSNYRSKIRGELINNRVIAELVLNRNIDESEFDADVQDELIKNIKNFAFLPDFNGDVKTYITFELVCRGGRGTGLYKDVSLHFFIFTHHSIMYPKTTHGKFTQLLRTDLIDEEIQNMFNDNLNFGCGRMICVEDDMLKVANDYYGRKLKFVVSDLGKKVCQ